MKPYAMWPAELELTYLPPGWAGAIDPLVQGAALRVRCGAVSGVILLPPAHALGQVLEYRAIVECDPLAPKDDV